jgi:hypothetical protein
MAADWTTRVRFPERAGPTSILTLDLQRLLCSGTDGSLLDRIWGLHSSNEPALSVRVSGVLLPYRGICINRMLRRYECGRLTLFRDCTTCSAKNA